MALINCPECNKEISDTAPSCPNCGYVLKKHPVQITQSAPTAQKEPSPPGYSWQIGKIIAVLILILVFRAACARLDEIYKKTNINTWIYSEDIDQMDNTKKTYASLDSENSIKFNYPYGDSDFTLNIRTWKGSTDVYLTCSKCQFIAGFGGSKTYRVKFDDEAPFKVTATHTSSGGSKTVFLGSETKLISKLKKAEKMMIEAEFYKTGYEQINFSTKGLKWK